jgi:hypothetical protein
MVLFLVALLAAYVGVWVPLATSLQAQVGKTKLMLMIVPIELLMRMKTVAKVLLETSASQQQQDLIQENTAGTAAGGAGEA